VGRLKEDGWTYSTIHNLFVENFKFEGRPDTTITCGNCQVNINLCRMVDWEEYVDSIKNKTFHGCKDRIHMVGGTTLPVHGGKPRGLGLPQHIDLNCYFPHVQDLKLGRIQRARKTYIRSQNKTYQDELQFWNYGVSVYFNFKQYRTRELYEIYAEAGLCPVCAVEETEDGANCDFVEEPEDEDDNEAEEEPPMLAPF